MVLTVFKSLGFPRRRVNVTDEPSPPAHVMLNESPTVRVAGSDVNATLVACAYANAAKGAIAKSDRNETILSNYLLVSAGPKVDGSTNIEGFSWS